MNQPETPNIGKDTIIMINVDDPAFRDSLAREIAKRNQTQDGFLQKYWRPAAAVLYLSLCFLDYAVRPIVNQYYARDFDLVTATIAIEKLEPATQVRALEIASRNELWPPIMNEFVHLAFGAMLSAAATTRGMEKIQREKNRAGSDVPGRPV